MRPLELADENASTEGDTLLDILLHRTALFERLRQSALSLNLLRSIILDTWQICLLASWVAFLSVQVVR